MLAETLRSERGFTLTELMVSMALIGLILGGMLTLQVTGQEAYLSGSNQVESQESGRIALQRMVTEIRSAGLDPQGVTTVQPPLVPPWTKIINPSATGFTIQNDWDGSGTINNAITVTVNGTPHGEQIAYSLNGAQLQRREFGIDGAAQTVIDGVDALTFTYYDANNVAIANPGANLTAIRSIGIVLRTRPTDQPTVSRGRVWISMNDQVRIRN